MAALPGYIKTQIGESQTIRYWCRRSSYEIIHELGVGIGGATAWAAFIYDLWQWTGWDRILFLLIPCAFGLYYFGWEYLKWINEYHIITEYDHLNGGVYYRFRGVFEYDHENVAIHAQGPVIKMRTPPEAWFWQKATGQNLGRLILIDQSREVLSNTMMPTKFGKVIQDVKGSPPQQKLEDDPTVVAYSKEIRNILASGALPEWKAKLMLDHFWGKVIADEY